MRLRKSIVMSVLALGIAVPGSVAFAMNDTHSRANGISSGVIDQARAILIAKGKLEGTVTRIHLESRKVKAVWKIRILSTDKTKRGDFRIDGRTGDILKMKMKNVYSRRHGERGIHGSMK